MRAAREGARHVQLGHMAAETIELPAPVVRSGALDIFGFAVFHAPADVRRAAYLRLTDLAARGDVSIDVDVIPLREVASAWQRQREGAGAKLVISCRE